MTEKTIIIESPNGMHARPAGELVKLAKSLGPVKISLSTETKTANAVSMLSVLALGLKAGTAVSVKADGDSPEAENTALAAICDFIASVKD